MQKKSVIEHSKIKKLTAGLSYKDLETFVRIFNTDLSERGYTISYIHRHSEVLVDIIRNNDSSDVGAYFSEYFITKSVKRKIELRYGQIRLNQYLEKMSRRPRPTVPFSIFQYEYWMSTGLTENEAQVKVTNIQRLNVLKRKTGSYKNFGSKLRYSLEFWTLKGYSSEEAEILRLPYLSKMKNDLPSLINRYGEVEGNIKYMNRIIRYKASMLSIISTKRTGGYVSRESLLFFIPLYKKCRRLGIKRSEIYFGISGSREFFIRDPDLIENRGRFYDFTIPSLGIVIEYHGIFWHSRTDISWKNPWLDQNESVILDQNKKKLAEMRKLNYHIVWSDDNHKEKIDEEFTHIRNRFGAKMLQ